MAIGALSRTDRTPMLMWDAWPATSESPEALRAERERLQEGEPLSAKPRLLGTDTLRRLAELNWQLRRRELTLGPQLVMAEKLSVAAALEEQPAAPIDHGEQCIFALMQIVKYHPVNLLASTDDTLFHLGVLLVNLGETNRAKQVFHRLISRNPDNIHIGAAYVQFGQYYSERKDSSEAAAFFVKALEAPPRINGMTAYARYALAHELARQGELDLAGRAMRDAIDDAKLFRNGHSDLIIEAATTELPAFAAR